MVLNGRTSENYWNDLNILSATKYGTSESITPQGVLSNGLRPVFTVNPNVKVTKGQNGTKILSVQ